MNKTDLTKGPVIKSILLFTIPFLIGNIFSTLYSVADSVIVGVCINSNAFAAIGATAGLYSFSSMIPSQFGIGFASVIAQHFGANNQKLIKKSFAMSIMLSILISLFVTIIFSVFAKPALALFKTPTELMDMAYSYFIIVILGLTATSLHMLFFAVLRAIGASTPPLIFIIVASVVNIICDFFFIELFNKSTMGAAVATIMSHIITIVLSAIYIIKKQPVLHIKFKDFVPDWAVIKNLLRIGFPMSTLAITLSGGLIITQIMGNTLGTTYVTAITAGQRISGIISCPLAAFASSITFFVSQNYGAGKYSRIVKGSSSVLKICYIICAFFLTVCVFLGKPLISVIASTTDTDIINYGYRYVVSYGIFSFALASVFIQRGVLPGIDRVRLIPLSGVADVVGKILPPIITFAVFSDPSMKFWGLCFTDASAWIFTMAVVSFDYLFAMRKFKKMSDRDTGVPFIH